MNVGASTQDPAAAGRLVELETDPLPNHPVHYRQPPETPFRAEEKSDTTLLFGGLTGRHEKLIQAVFQSAGYRCELLPTPDLEAFRIGKEFGNSGDCNPVYFTIGSLIQYLRGLRQKGLSNEEICSRYVFLTAGSCGPCRFGTYESEYRFALQNAGFESFRVLVFQQQKGVRQTGQDGLQYTMDFGLGILNALNLGDVLGGVLYRVRPYELTPGKSDQVISDCLNDLSLFLRERPIFDLMQHLPDWAAGHRGDLRDRGFRFLNNLGKSRKHLYAREYREVLESAAERINRIDVDRTRVRPIVKITGEFWGQLTEGDGNYNMFGFLEEEGAEVLIDPLSEWVRYLLYQVRTQLFERRRLEAVAAETRSWRLFKRAADWWGFERQRLLLSLAEKVHAAQFDRINRILGGLGHRLVPQSELARLAHPFYNSRARGGEGHLEVGKSIYYTLHHQCHAVLSLKPFGCMPSTQSDAVQASVTQHYPGMLFLPVETAGDGEIHALSRVQMALREAHLKAQGEFEQVLRNTGKSLDTIRQFVEAHPVLRRPFYPIPALPGVAGTAARFVVHVSDLIDGRASFRKL